jgi:hypothetical protein
MIAKPNVVYEHVTPIANFSLGHERKKKMDVNCIVVHNFKRTEMSLKLCTKSSVEICVTCPSDRRNQFIHNIVQTIPYKIIVCVISYEKLIISVLVEIGPYEAKLSRI